MKDKEIRFQVQIIVEPDDDIFHAYCPSLKGVHVSGDTEKEAVQNCCEAILQHIGVLLDCGDPIPIGNIHREESRLSLYSSLLRTISDHCKRSKVARAHSEIHELPLVA